MISGECGRLAAHKQVPDLPPKAVPNLPRIALRVGALDRSYLLYVPDIAGTAPRPLVVVYHGGGGTPQIALEATEILDRAAARGWAVALPEATRPDSTQPAHFLKNPAFWNAGLPRGLVWKRRIDDLGFTAALLDDVASRTAIDPNRIFAMGFSNGAAMALRVGLELSARVAAVAGVAGHPGCATRPRNARSPCST
jgi:polyhydroxybutyrate depolymerase